MTFPFPPLSQVIFVVPEIGFPQSRTRSNGSFAPATSQCSRWAGEAWSNHGTKRWGAKSFGRRTSLRRTCVRMGSFQTFGDPDFVFRGNNVGPAKFRILHLLK